MSPAATFRRTDRLKPLPKLRSLTDDDGRGLLPAHRGATSERAREQATQLVQGALKVSLTPCGPQMMRNNCRAAWGRARRGGVDRMLGQCHLNGDSAFYAFHFLVNPPKVAYREDLEATHPISRSRESADRRITT
jgi:hypothetical protein